MKNKTKVILISGFLGVGKTTLINELLKQQKDKNISIILNEFGEINLESEFIETKDVTSVELKSGCMCCIAKSDIPRTIEYILDQAPHTDYIVIESSGLSEPGAVAKALHNDELKNKVILELTICVIDTSTYLESYTEHEIINHQLADSDIILLSKTSESNTDTIEKVKEKILALDKNFKILSWDDTFDSSFLFLENTKELQREHDKKTLTHSHETYDEIWLESIPPLEYFNLKNFLENLPGNVIRSKGIAYCKGSNGIEKFLIQKAGHSTKVLRDDIEKDDDLKTSILILGKDLPKKLIEENFNRLS